jgi:hypothetical protein
MVMRKLRYYCALVWREYLVGAPGILLVSGVRRSCPFQTVRGFRVGDPAPETRVCFTTHVDEAMALIANCDPIRWKRVQREIRIIVNAGSTWSSCYGRASRICMMDFRSFYNPDDTCMTVRILASQLIYQATYGHLYSRGIVPGRQIRQRVATLRWKETERFLRQRVRMTTLPLEADSSTAPPSGVNWKWVTSEIREIIASK